MKPAPEGLPVLHCPHCDKPLPLREITTDNHSPHTLQFDVVLTQDSAGALCLAIVVWPPDEHPTTIPDRLFKPDKPS